MSQESSNEIRSSSSATRPAHLAIKVLISIWIVYHILAVSLLPNSESVVGRRLGWIFLPYANTFIFNRTWQFFSPGPSPMFYLRYQAVNSTGPDQREMPEQQFPIPRKPGEYSDYQVRVGAGMRYFAMQEPLFEKYFVEYLCRMNPGSVALDVHSEMQEVASLERASQDQSSTNESGHYNLPSRTYDCPVTGVPHE